MMTAICRALKPGGRVALVEYHLEDPAVEIKLVHKMTVAQVKKEMSVLPLAWGGRSRCCRASTSSSSERPLDNHAGRNSLRGAQLPPWRRRRWR